MKGEIDNKFLTSVFTGKKETHREPEKQMGT